MMGVFDFLKKAVALPIVTAGNILGNVVVKAMGRTPGKPVTTKQFLESKTGKAVTYGILATGTALGVAVAPAIVGSTAVRQVAKKGAVVLITNPLGVLKTAAGGLLTAGFVSGGGLLLAPKIFSGAKAGTEVLTGEKDLTSENIDEALRTGLGLLGAGAVGVGAGYVAEKVFGDDEDKTPTPTLPKDKTLPTDEAKPITPETTTIQTGKRKRRKAKAVISPSVRQSVRVNVISNNSAHRITKNYLRERILN